MMFKHRRTWLGIGLSVLCLALILWRVDLKQVWEAILVADWQAWSVVIAAYVSFMLLRAWRWQMMLGDGARYWPVFHAQSIGYLLLSIMPFRIGDLGRAYLVGQQPGLSSLRALSSVVLERVLDMLVIVVLFTLTLPFVPTLPPLIGRAGLTFGTLAIVCFGLLLAAASRRLYALKLTEWVLQRISWLETEAWLKRADSFLTGFQVLTDWGLLLPVLGLSVAVWLAGVVAYYWGIGAFWPEVTWPASVFTLCAAAFGLSVPSSPSGVGVFHASIWLALPVFSATKAQALGFAFVYHALTLIIVFILGGIGLRQNGQAIGEILTATQRFVVRRQPVESTRFVRNLLVESSQTGNNMETGNASNPINCCEVCHSCEVTQIFNSIRGQVFRCLTCGVFFVEDKGLTPNNQETLFYSTIDEQKYVAYFEPFRKGQYRYVLQNLGLKPGISFLDVGASYGWMVQVGMELGLDSYGLEPGDVQYDPVLTKRIFKKDLQEYAQTTKRCFDVITIWHVLEHLQKPVEAMRWMYQLLDEGGYLIIAVPTTDGRMFRLGLFLQKRFGRSELLNELFYFHNPNMHFFYYNESSVKELLKQVRLEVSSVQTIESFDWTTIYRRVNSPIGRILLRVIGPFIALSGFTGKENLIVVARKQSVLKHS